MESRRSFLAAALAWLASLVALVWPRRALSAPSRARGPFTRPSRPARPDTVTWGNEEIYSRNLRLYRDFGLLLDEMHDHLCKTGHMVLCADDPMTRRIAFSTFGPDPEDPSEELSVLWEIPLTACKTMSPDTLPRSFCSKDLSPAERQEAYDLFCETMKDRRKLAAAYFKASQERFKAGLGPLPHNS